MSGLEIVKAKGEGQESRTQTLVHDVQECRNTAITLSSVPKEVRAYAFIWNFYDFEGYD